MTTAGLADAPATLRQLHLHYVAGRFEHAAGLGESMVRRPGSSRWLGRVHYYTAMAHFQLGRPEAGAPLLREAWKHARELGEPEMVVECKAADAALAILTQARNAVDVAGDALSAGRRLSMLPRPLEARLLTHLACAYQNKGEWSLALTTAMEALSRMQETFDLHRHAILFGCIALANMELGRLDPAIDNVTRSIELAALKHNTIGLALSENNLGYMLLLRGQFEDARDHLERSLRLYERAGLERGRSNVLLSLGELSLAEGLPGRGKDLALRGLDVAHRMGEESNTAQAHVLLGRIAEALSEPDVADAEFKEAFAQFVRYHAPGWIERSHRQYADVLDRRGQARLADAHRKEAATAAAG